MSIIKYKTQKAVAHAQRAPQPFGFGLFITSTYLQQIAKTPTTNFFIKAPLRGAFTKKLGLV
jgi:hypothetical protein